MATKKSLAQKILDISNDVGVINKDAKNNFSGYEYISNAAVATAVRNACIEHKVLILPSVIGHSEDVYIDEKKKQNVRTTVDMKFTFIDVESSDTFEVHFAGSDTDKSGKSMSQAITACTKYFYFKQFNITSSEGDSDSQSVEVVVAEKVATTTAPAKNWLKKEDYESSLGMKPEMIQKVLDKYNNTNGNFITKAQKDGLEKVLKLNKVIN